MKINPIKVDDNLEKYHYLEFESWKDNIEEENSCSYVKSFGTSTNAKGNNVTNLQCNRCGSYKPKRNGKRRSKSSGKKYNKNNFFKLQISIYLHGTVSHYRYIFP